MKQSTSPTFAAQHGRAHPLGCTDTPAGTNFAIYARDTSDVTLLLYPPSSSSSLSESASPSDPPAAAVEFKLDPAANQTGHVWHVLLSPSPSGFSYEWRVGSPDPRWKSNLCLDPYARALDSARGPSSFNNSSIAPYNPRAVVPTCHASSFDWQGVARPRVPWPSTVIYEMHVRGFTAGGTYAHVVSRIPYLKSLGVTAVELLPVMEFNEREWSKINPNTNKPLCQYWGYSTVAFFAPMNRFSRQGNDPSASTHEFQYMVRELHRAGIEVILDVVYNHTAEMGNDFVGPGFYGMKQLAPFSYYHMRDNGATFINHSGCGNTVNCNNVAVQDLIIESLRYWTHEMGVDGFRFDLASIMTRSADDCEGLQNPPLIERIAKDSALRGVKLIAEPWDCGGLYLVGNFPHYGVFAEWNGKFRDVVRQFVKGDAGMVGEFATRLCGSQDLYGKGGRKPYHSLNFVTAHDGFTMRDLVSYNDKHNGANGENNNDGESHNLSWNCGVEGDTNDDGVKQLRERQIRNLLVALFVAVGTPMLSMGDEYGHTRYGNNNVWCQDSSLSWFQWDNAKAEKDRLLKFTAGLVKLKTSLKALQRSHFLSDKDVQWHGVNAWHPDWNSGYNFLAMTLKADVDVYVAFNCGGEQRDVELPHQDQKWARVADTNLQGDKAFANPGEETTLHPASRYRMAPHSVLVLRSVQGTNEAATADLTTAFEEMAVEDECAF